MRVIKKQEISIKLFLNEEEARWLMGLMQNPFNGLSPNEENSKDSEMRNSFWTALQGQGIRP